MKTKPIFSVKVKSHSSSCHPIFSIEFHSSRSMLCRFILFQSVALTIDDIVKDFARIRCMISNPYIVCYICSSRMRVLGDKEPVFKLTHFLHWTNYTAVRQRVNMVMKTGKRVGNVQYVSRKWNASSFTIVISIMIRSI